MEDHSRQVASDRYPHYFDVSTRLPPGASGERKLPQSFILGLQRRSEHGSMPSVCTQRHPLQLSRWRRFTSLSACWPIPISVGVRQATGRKASGYAWWRRPGGALGTPETRSRFRNKWHEMGLFFERDAGHGRCWGCALPVCRLLSVVSLCLSANAVSGLSRRGHQPGKQKWSVQAGEN